ncbi:MAG: class I fructose-bisphosphate aldolase [Patescibacteria group bacterium]
MSNHARLYETVAALMASGKGILAADESDGTAGKRLAQVHLPNEPEHRRKFRQLLFTAPDLEHYLSGVILYDSTIRNETDDGIPFVDVLTARGIVPGIKVDRGTVPLHGFKEEVVTQGLDDLGERFAEYYDMGARFAKWRAVFTIEEDERPTEECIEINAIMLARYAQLAQAAGLVPIVEPEVIHAGDHSLEQAELVTTKVLQVIFHTLQRYRVDLGGLILKSSMVLAGDGHREQTSPEAVANATLRTFHLSVPHQCGGIVFLSGGQSPERATNNLNAIAQQGEQPWPITFSFSRAIEEPFLQAWGGQAEQADAAQGVLRDICARNSQASLGEL